MTDTMTDTKTEPAGLPEGPFVGLPAFSQLVRDALECAVHEGWQEMVWSDATFSQWPLAEKAVTDSLQAWARNGRKLVLLARRFDEIQRYQARFVTWRIRWDHIVTCRICKAVDESDFPSALWSPHWLMQRLDLVRSTGIATCDAQRRVLLRQQFDEMLHQSSPGFPASTLGL